MVKNKVAPPFKEAEFDLIYGQGISRLGELIDIASDNNIIDKSGSWFSYGGDRLGQGRENAKKFLEENPVIQDEIMRKVRAELGMDGANDDEVVSSKPADDAKATA